MRKKYTKSFPVGLVPVAGIFALLCAMVVGPELATIGSAYADDGDGTSSSQASIAIALDKTSLALGGRGVEAAGPNNFYADSTTATVTTVNSTGYNVFMSAAGKDGQDEYTSALVNEDAKQYKVSTLADSITLQYTTSDGKRSYSNGFTSNAWGYNIVNLTQDAAEITGEAMFYPVPLDTTVINASLDTSDADDSVKETVEAAVSELQADAKKKDAAERTHLSSNIYTSNVATGEATDGTAPDQLELTIGARVDNTVPAGDYNNTLVLTAITNLAPFDVLFDGNASDGGTAVEKITTLSGNGVEMPANTYTKTGYHFLGWNTDKDATTALYQAGETVAGLEPNGTDDAGNDILTLYAIWEVNTYTIAYNGNGHTNSATMASLTGKKYSESLTLTANAFAKTGWHFLGWSHSASATSATYTNSQANVEVATLAAGASKQNEDGATINLYAVWEVNTYNIAYNGNGNTGGSTSAQNGQKYNTSITLRTNGFTKTGHSFYRWSHSTANNTYIYTSGQTSVSVQTLAERANVVNTNGATINLYAKWDANSHTVSVTKGTGVTGTATGTGTHYAGEKVTLGGISAASGYHGLIWASSDVTLSSTTATNPTFVMPDKDVTVTVTSTGNTYTIAYNNGGGSGTMNPTTNAVYGQTKALSANTFTRTNYYFRGWNRATGQTAVQYGNAQGTSVTINVKDLVDAAGQANNNGATITLYAVWGDFITLKDNKSYTKYSVGSFNWANAQSACPSGTHLPTADEFDKLLTAYGGAKYSGYGEPYGWRDGGADLYNATGWSDGYWSSTEYASNTSRAWRLYVYSSSSYVRYEVGYYKTNSLNVVCVKS